MPDLRLVLVDFKNIVQKYQCKGCLGKGKDEILEIYCENTVVKDTYDQTFKLMQNYSNLTQDIFQLKLD